MIEEVESGTAVSVSSERHNEHCSKGPDSKSSGTEDKVRKVPLVYASYDMQAKSSGSTEHSRGGGSIL